jgi:CDP-glucose 4,6-dehydratase
MENPPGQRLRELPGPILLTGHTGFKGTWMTFLLEHLELPVIGYSLPAEKDSLFDRAGRNGIISEKLGDIRDYQALEKFIDEHKPSAIIHMAAQPLVLKSYEIPRETFDVNVMGTVNVLDIAFKRDYIKSIIVVTTDKVYRNNNSGHLFKEEDPLEGKDPYSASKVGTESVVTAWQQIAQIQGGPKLLSVRAGNVIGGGDFADDRLIPDLVRGLLMGNSVKIRNPKSTRPWQHVLDSLVGYIQAFDYVLSGSSPNTLNFGPNNGCELTVELVASIFLDSLPDNLKKSISIETNLEERLLIKEAELLSLNSSRSRELIGWDPQISSKLAVIFTSKWWGKVINETASPSTATREDIAAYFSLARNSSIDMNLQDVENL